MKLITPKMRTDQPDNDGWTIPTGKQIPVVINQSTGQIEWQHKGEKLTAAEIAYVAAALNIKRPPVDRWQRIKSAILNGKKQGEIVKMYEGQTGFTLSEVKKIRSALSKFNKWDLKGRYQKKDKKKNIPLEIIKPLKNK